MGTDIHTMVEEYDKEYKGWYIPYTLSFEVPEFRNYKAFAKLAGVRGTGPEPKGLPDDASITVRRHFIEDKHDDVIHSHSYCSLKKYLQAYFSVDERHKLAEFNLIGYDSLNDYEKDTFDALKDIHDMLNDKDLMTRKIRVIFCFDC